MSKEKFQNYNACSSVSRSASSHDNNHDHAHNHIETHIHDHSQECSVKNGECPSCHRHSHEHEHEHEQENIKIKIIRMSATFILGAAGFAAKGIYDAELVSKLLFFIGYIISGYDVILHSLKNIARGRIFDECFLMSLATIGALLIGEYAESTAVMLFYQLGETLQDSAAGKSRKAIKDLVSVTADKARVIRDGKEKMISPEEIAIGDTVIVRAGEKIPVDGKAVSGNVSLDTSAITGESALRDIFAGDKIFSGSIVSGGVLTMTAEKQYSDSTAAKIIRLIEEASEKKAKAESFVTRFSKIYTPLVVILAFLVAFVPPIFGADLYDYVHRGLVFLVVSCPCALVLSIPIAYFAGIGAASSRGILVKGGNYLDILAKAKTAVFDKTGTLTKGVFEVSEIIPAENVSKETLIRLAVHGECISNHPIARSVSSLSSADINAVSNAKELPGLGITCTFEGKELICGNTKLFDQKKIALNSGEDTSSCIYVGYDGQYVGKLILSDIIKDDSADTIENLKKLGIENCIMLTGDNKYTADKVAKKLKMTKVYSQLLPQDKTEIFEKIKNKYSGNTIFAGDGINDAPVIASADAGIAMGSLGSDAAIEAADVVLMTDEPQKIVTAVKIARSVRKKVIINIVFILAVKSAILASAIAGYDSMWLAVFADIGTALISTLHSVSLLHEKF